MKAGKVWGETILIKDTPFCRMAYIRVKAGSRCSMHLHQHMTNLFFVISGRLRIVAEKNDYNLVDETELGPMEFTEVPPNENHRFEAITDLTAIELYWPVAVGDDIVRRDCGKA